MRINWKLRLQNKATLLAIVVQVVTLVYTVLGLFGILPGVGEEQVKTVVYLFVELLCLLGIVVDPTTEGLGDSVQALGYEKPKS